MTTATPAATPLNSEVWPAAAVLTFREPVPVRAPTYSEWFEANVLRSRWLSWFATFYVHWLIVLTLAVLIVHVPEQFEAFMLDGSVATREPIEDVPFETTELVLDSIVPSPDVQAEANTNVLEAESRNADLMAAVDAIPADNAIPAGVLALARQFADTKNEPAAAVPEQPLPTPPSAVTIGNFSVWTEPDNPHPEQPYRIVIQIRLPEGTRVYNVNDLEGVVVGTDGYRKPIPGQIAGTLPIQGGCVRFVVPIVSADERVEDTIFIRSKLLKETQKLQIRF